MSTDDQPATGLGRMSADWDQRARENALHYVNSAEQDWDIEAFFRTGEQNVEQYVLNDMENICQGKEPGQMSVVEIGCGVGRLTAPLSKLFGHVYAVDVSSEMLNRARANLAERGGGGRNICAFRWTVPAGRTEWRSGLCIFVHRFPAHSFA